MGDLISTNIDDFIEYFLKNGLQMDILDYQKVESGGEGYTVIYVSNLNDTQAEVLENIGFERIKDDLWIFCGFEIDIDKLIDSAKWYFEDLQKERWTELIYLRSYIDNIFYTQCNKKTLFRTTHNTPKIILKWYGKLALDEPTFNDFIVDLYKLLIDSLPNEINEICNSKFIEGVKCIRHAKIAHDSSKIKQLEIANRYICELTGTDTLRHWHQFTTAQIHIIDDGIEFLKDINSKPGEIIEVLSNSET